MTMIIKAFSPDDKATEVFHIVGPAVARMPSRSHLGLEIFKLLL